MAPIKFEEQLKDKLEKRNLQPSVDSWTKLSERLDNEEKASKKSWLGWLSIAAGLIIFLAVAIQMFSNKVNQNIEPVLVKEDINNNKIENDNSNINEDKTTNLAIEEDKVEQKTEDHNTKPEIVNYKSVTHNKQKAKTQYANTNKGESSDFKVSNKTINEEQSIINQSEIKEEVVVKAIAQFKEDNKTVTDREVDSLLKLASKELLMDKLKKETAKTVDAKSLLQDVEEEMGQSFRSKVFEALKDSYETVKTTVAERNN